MANIYSLINFISKWEGGYVNNPSDPGGPTNKGVTLKIWKKKGYDKNKDGAIDLADLQMVTHQDMIEVVLRPHYWEPWLADRIKDQSVANSLVDWTWCSGAKIVPLVQWILEVKPDGIVGPQTLKAINQYPDQEALFEKIKSERTAGIHKLCKKRPELMQFKNGWINRIADLKYLPLLLLSCLFVGLVSCTSLVKQPVVAHAIRQQAQQAQQAEVTDQEHRHLAQADEVHQATTTDSMEETLSLAFSLPLQAEVQAMQARIHTMQAQALPLMVHGFATLRSLRKTQQADSNSTSNTLARAVQQSAHNFQEFYANDSLAITRRAKARRVITLQNFLPLLLMASSFFLFAFFYDKIHRWKSR